jgi:hypothetical protein
MAGDCSRAQSAGKIVHNCLSYRAPEGDLEASRNMCCSQVTPTYLRSLVRICRYRYEGPSTFRSPTFDDRGFTSPASETLAQMARYWFSFRKQRTPWSRYSKLLTSRTSQGIFDLLASRSDWDALTHPAAIHLSMEIAAHFATASRSNWQGGSRYYRESAPLVHSCIKD